MTGTTGINHELENHGIFWLWAGGAKRKAT
jgi:hypothetical protein